MKIKIIGTQQARRDLRTVNLNDPPETRWENILRQDGKAVNKLLRQAATWMPAYMSGLGEWAFGNAYKFSGGYYVEEIQAIADFAGISFGALCMLQAQYELAHAAEYAGSIVSGGIGCTAGAVQDPRLGLIHLRNMDWGLSAIKGATRLIHFTQGKREFVMVAVVGFVGALSGMVPGAFSVTMNYAPPSERPGFFDIGPAFLLRHVLETCDTMKEAIRVLRETPLAAPAFFTVSGIDEAVTVECTRTEYAINKMAGGTLAQANHHNAKHFKDLNDALDEDVFEFSKVRQKCMEDLLTESHKTIASWGTVLRRYPICNANTQQSMIFRPAQGEVWLGG